MYLILIRHTKVSIDSNICYGQLDVPLEKNYEIEFQKIKKFLLQFEPYQILTSPSNRCKQLARCLRKDNFFENSVLLEMNFGNWEGKNWGEIPQLEIELWYEDFVNYKIPNGESFQELYFRINHFFKNFNFTQNQVWITHAGVIRSLVCSVFNLDLKHAFSFDVDYGSITILQKKYDKWNLKTLNVNLENLTYILNTEF